MAFTAATPLGEQAVNMCRSLVLLRNTFGFDSVSALLLFLIHNPAIQGLIENLEDEYHATAQ